MSNVSLSKMKATTVETTDGKTVITLYKTPIVTFDDKQITLNHGGWRTSTTKSRMNQVSQIYDLGFTVYQSGYDWYINFKGKKYGFFHENTITLERGGRK